MEFGIVCLFLACLAATTLAKFQGFDVPIFEEPALPQCPPETKPCKILVKRISTDGSAHRIYSSEEICQCPDGSCPNGWDNAPENTFTRYLQSIDRLLTLQMKFCRPMQPQRPCNRGEVALVAKGNSLIPTEIVEYNCQCPTNRPMVLSKAWLQNFREQYQEYVCSMPTCRRPDSQCMSVSNQPSRYRYTVFQCDCGRGKSCQEESGRRFYGSVTKGLCSSANN